MIKTYSELMKLPDYQSRLDYLYLGDNNVSSPRSISTKFYKSAMWIKLRAQIIMRDNVCDIGILSLPINDKIIVHHINPITEEDIINMTDKLVNPENLITLSIVTHNIIHYGTADRFIEDIIDRKEGDTIEWVRMF
jgi:hypothetical protein